MSVSITNLSEQPTPRLPYRSIAKKILGAPYEVSLVFPQVQLAVKLHRQWKKKNGPANVLAFPLAASSGEIFISLEKAKIEHVSFAMPYRAYVGFLFIHACLHLKGMDHGATMEREEKRMLRAFKLASR